MQGLQPFAARDTRHKSGVHTDLTIKDSCGPDWSEGFYMAS